MKNRTNILVERTECILRDKAWLTNMIQARSAGMHLTSLMIKQILSMRVTKNIIFT